MRNLRNAQDTGFHFKWHQTSGSKRGRMQGLDAMLPFREPWISIWPITVEICQHATLRVMYKSLRNTISGLPLRTLEPTGQWSPSAVRTILSDAPCQTPPCIACGVRTRGSFGRHPLQQYMKLRYSSRPLPFPAAPGVPMQRQGVSRRGSSRGRGRDSHGRPLSHG